MLPIMPNLGVLILLVTVWLVGVKGKCSYSLFIIGTLLYFSITLATKDLSGEGNDYVTYFFNVKDGFYPTWSESKLDFLFWYIASFIMEYISKQNSFLFFTIINLISFFPYYLLSKYVNKMIFVNESSKFFALFFLIFLTSFSFWNLYGNYIRQAWVFSYSIAVMISLLERRFLATLVYSAIVISAHSTGILFLIFIFTSSIFQRLNLKSIGLYAIIICIIFIVFPIFNLFINFIPADISSKLDFYSSWAGSDFGRTAAFRLVLAYITLYIIDFTLIAKENEFNPLYNSLYFVFIMLIVVISIISDITKVVERLYYPSFVLFFLILSLQYGLLIRKMNRNNKSILLISTLIIGLPLLTYSFYSSLFYNVSYFNGDLNNFLTFSIFDYNYG